LRQFRRVYDLEVNVTAKKIPSIKNDDDDTSGYKLWPFKSAEISVNGDRNNGGIDLVENPELIDKIHEATTENGLRDLLVSMNAPGRAFMTLGCLTGVDGAYFSYVEFTPRDEVLSREVTAIKAIHQQWVLWVSENCSIHPGLEDALHQNVEWAYRTFSLRGNEPQYLITIYSRAQSARDHGTLLSWLHNFLCSIDQTTLPRTSA
jgi:hypothetical protein